MSTLKYRDMEFFPFTKDLHKFLINDGYTALRSLGYIQDSHFFKEKGINIDGYALLPDSYIFFEDGEEVKDTGNELKISRSVHLPKDPNDPTREDILKQSHMVGKIEEILKRFGEKDDKSYREIGWTEEAPPNVNIAEKGLEFGINHDRVRELYFNPDGIKFYLMLDIKEAEGHRLLARKLKDGVL